TTSASGTAWPRRSDAIGDLIADLPDNGECRRQCDEDIPVNLFGLTGMTSGRREDQSSVSLDRIGATDATVWPSSRFITRTPVAPRPCGEVSRAGSTERVAVRHTGAP